jgi:hypothetical protein
MTSTVSQNISADNTENTKNTKDNRMILTATFSGEAVFKLPDNLDLKDETIVEEYGVKYGTLWIAYTTEEYYKQYAGTDKPSENNYHIQKIQQSEDISINWKYPDSIELMTAADRCVEYSDDEEDEEDEEEEN